MELKHDFAFIVCISTLSAVPFLEIVYKYFWCLLMNSILFNLSKKKKHFIVQGYSSICHSDMGLSALFVLAGALSLLTGI